MATQGKGTCATCSHALPVGMLAGFKHEDYAHCDLPPEGLPVKAWIIGLKSGCGHVPSKWRKR